MEAFDNLDQTTASTALAQFLELVEAQSQERSERLLEQAAAMDRLRAVASRRK